MNGVQVWLNRLGQGRVSAAGLVPSTAGYNSSRVVGAAGFLTIPRVTSRFPSFTHQLPATTVVPSALLLPSQWPASQNDEYLLAVEESELEEKLTDVKNTNTNLAVIGKITQDNDKEEFDGEADDDEVDNADESDGDEFEQGTG